MSLPLGQHRALALTNSPASPPPFVGSVCDPPPRVRHLLQSAVAAEMAARGTARRHAFRTTRYLLAACRTAGISLTAVAVLLGVRPESVRARSNMDGVVATITFAALADVSLETIREWCRAGLLPPASVDEQYQTGYPASALVVAFLHHDDPGI